MNAIKYLKQNHYNDTIITKDITLAKFCIVKSTYKHTFEIPCNLLNIVYSGKKILHTKNGDIEVKAGEAFFLTKGEYVMSEVVGEEDYTCFLIFFEHFLMKELVSNLPFALNNKQVISNKNIFKFQMNELFKNSIENLKFYLEKKLKFGDELIELKLKELIFLVLSSNSKDDFIGFCQNLTLDKNDLKSFMENSFEQDLSIEEFAILSGRSLSSFKSEFKSIFNETPMKWILKKRVEKGKFLIQELGYDVGVAALNVGFKTHSHFTRVYKQYYNKTPNLRDK